MLVERDVKQITVPSNGLETLRLPSKDSNRLNRPPFSLQTTFFVYIYIYTFDKNIETSPL